ncbi:carboxymuconolactone decarboxylase family protein [Streptomyces koelreuteriae]|uniref:carboxymuconolactone decarboxylase family protein n=1 Tax=Streptomyces koelreuteriae TaxID=2838015 RepID=UPI003EBDABC3
MAAVVAHGFGRRAAASDEKGAGSGRSYRSRRLFDRFFGGGLLDRGHLTLKQREIAIDRVTARCGSEYEWGVHVSAFAEKAGLTRDQIASTCAGGPEDDCWSEEESCLVRLCDRIDAGCTLDDEDWTDGLSLPLEPWAARFSQYGAAVARDDHGTRSPSP